MAINFFLEGKLYGKEAVLNLQGAVAVVTGSSRGIGASIAEELGRGGAKVVVNYSGSKEPAEKLAEKINQFGGESKAIAVQASVGDPEQAQKLIDETVENFGRVDILVNNAGITIDKTLKKLSIEDWNKVIEVDLNSCYYTVKAALPHMLENEDGGHIINMSSFVGEAGNFGQTNYAAAKAGLLGFTKAAALELARNNIKVNAICPGFIETEMVAAMPEEAKEKVLKLVPLRRFGTPEEIAKGVRYLVEDGDFITGNALDINGGIYMRS